MWTGQFWKRAFERAVKTFAQVMVALLTVGGVAAAADAPGILDVNWVGALSVAGLAFIVSLLTSLGSVKVGDADTPDLVKAVPVAPDGEDVQRPA